MSSRLTIRGNSGCTVSLLNDSEKTPVICKMTDDPKYAPRLKAQIQKQKDAARRGVPVPEVYGVQDMPDNGCFVLMKHADGKNFYDFLIDASEGSVSRAVEQLKKLIADEIHYSKSAEIDAKVFLDKAASVLDNAKKTLPKTVGNRESVMKLIASISEKTASLMPDEREKIQIPVGVCHGDLTLSNVLFGEDGSLQYIDWLDSFIETPLQDMVKLRQDTCFKWSLNMIENRSQQLDCIVSKKLNDIDCEIDTWASMNFPFYKKHYHMMQTLSLFRILPYAKNEEMMKWIDQSISKLCAETGCNECF